MNSPPLSPLSSGNMDPMPFEKSRPRNLCIKIVLGATVISLLLVAIFAFTASPSTPFSSKTSSRTLSLSFSNTPFHNIHFSSTPTPPSSCETCVLHPGDSICQYGIDTIQLSRAYEGSGYRVRKFLEKALRGEQVTIGIIGGSVTAGHGLEAGQMTWHDRFFDGFQEMFPNSVLYNGASPDSGSAFFSYCFESMLPQDLDLYVVEMDVSNDASMYTLREDDFLLRGLLQLPQEPAVIRVSIPSLGQSDMIQGRMSTLLLAQFFDIPVISLTNPLLTHLLENPDAQSDFFIEGDDGEEDLQHVSHSSHQFLGDMMTLYFRKQVCETRRRSTSTAPPIPSKWPQKDSLGTVPRLRVWDRYNKESSVPPVHASCATIGSTYHELTPLPTASAGAWNIVDFVGKKAWYSKKIGSYISFPFTGTNVGVFIWTSNGTTTTDEPGMADCWVDNKHMQNTTVDGFKKGQIGRSRLFKVREGLPHGNHTVTCMLTHASSSSGHDFRLMGVASQ